MPEGNGEQIHTHSGHVHIPRAWLAAIFIVVVGVALFAGVDLARSNSDIICTRTFQDSGSCTGGSWGAWSLTSQSIDQNSCRATYNEARVYTGLRNTILSSISISANLHTHCNLSDEAFYGGSGTVTSQYSACQIQESRTRVVGGSGSGVSCVVPTSTSTTQGEITVDTNTETTGAVDDSKTTTVNGNYQLYLDMRDARLATSSITAMPALVHNGATTKIVWAASHVKTCTVTGSNGDTWTNLQSQAGGETSSAIAGQTTYTLDCTTALGTHLIEKATVNLIPVFNER